MAAISGPRNDALEPIGRGQLPQRLFHADVFRRARVLVRFHRGIGKEPAELLVDCAVLLQAAQEPVGVTGQRALEGEHVVELRRDAVLRGRPGFVRWVDLFKSPDRLDVDAGSIASLGHGVGARRRWPGDKSDDLHVLGRYRFSQVVSSCSLEWQFAERPLGQGAQSSPSLEMSWSKTAAASFGRFPRLCGSPPRARPRPHGTISRRECNRGRTGVTEGVRGDGRSDRRCWRRGAGPGQFPARGGRSHGPWLGGPRRAPHLQRTGCSVAGSSGAIAPPPIDFERLRLWRSCRPIRTTTFWSARNRSTASSTAVQLAASAVASSDACPIVLCQNGWGNAEVFRRALPSTASLQCPRHHGIRAGRAASCGPHSACRRGAHGVVVPRRPGGARATLRRPDRGGLPAETTATIERDLWAKMLYNCCLNPLGAILEVPYGRLGEPIRPARSWRQVAAEVFAVMRRPATRPIGTA